jgi:hypothetical protein
VADKLFTQHAREDEPLSRFLEERAAFVREAAMSYPADTFGRKTDEELVRQLISQTGFETGPLELAGDPEIGREPMAVDRTDKDGQKHPFWRWRASFPMRGYVDALTRWPDRFDGDPVGDNGTGYPAPEVYWESYGDTAHAYIDTPREGDERGINVPSERIATAADYLARAIAAANDQVLARARSLEEELRNLLGERRAAFDERGPQIDDAIQLARLNFGEPVLRDGVPPGEAPKAEIRSAPVALAKVIETRTFHDLIAATLRWGAAAQRDPGAFSVLEEEVLSSLLVATLNAVFDTAQREVFQNQGRTDIFVESFRDARENAAYFGEAKIWDGQARVAADVAQLLGYCSSAVVETMLLYYVKRKKIGEIVRRCRAAIEIAPGFEGWGEDEQGNAVALFRHPDHGTIVRVTLVFTHIPSLGEDEADNDDLAEGTPA